MLLENCSFRSLKEEAAELQAASDKKMLSAACMTGRVAVSSATL